MGRFHAAGEDTPSDGGGGGLSRVGCRGPNAWVEEVKGSRSSHQLSVWSVDSSSPTLDVGFHIQEPLSFWCGSFGKWQKGDRLFGC